MALDDKLDLDPIEAGIDLGDSPFIGGDPIEDDLDYSPYDEDGAKMVTEGGVEVTLDDEGGEVAVEVKDDEAGTEDSTETDADAGPTGDEVTEGEGDPADPEPDTVVDEDDGDAGEPEPKEPFIPKSRLDRQIRKTRQLEEQVQSLIDGQSAQNLDPVAPVAVVPAQDMVAATKEALELALEGDVDGAAIRLAEAQAARDAAVTDAATQSVAAQMTERQVQNALDQAKDRVEETYDFLDSTNSDTFEPELVSDVVALRDSYIGKGHEPGAALELAAEKIARIEYPERFTAAAPASETVAAKPKPQADLSAKAKASAAQPPATNQAGTTDAVESQEKMDVFNLSEEDFDRLTETQLAKLRGDFRTA